MGMTNLFTSNNKRENPSLESSENAAGSRYQPSERIDERSALLKSQRSSSSPSGSKSGRESPSHPKDLSSPSPSSLDETRQGPNGTKKDLEFGNQPSSSSPQIEDGHNRNGSSSSTIHGDPSFDPEHVPSSEHSPLLKPSPSSSALEASLPPSKRRLLNWWNASIWIVCIVLFGVFVGFTVKAAREGDVKFDLPQALRKAVGGGVSGALAMLLQVFLFMPLRTIMNFQYRFGHSFTGAISHLNRDGGTGTDGLPTPRWKRGFPYRYYSGLLAALIQGPIARFGDTFANAGILSLVSGNTFLSSLPKFIQTIFASLAAALFRMVLTPVDTVKTTLQAHGSPGTKILRDRIRVNGIGTMWFGAWATAGATFVGHYPWFGTYNTLEANLPHPCPDPKTTTALLSSIFLLSSSQVNLTQDPDDPDLDLCRRHHLALIFLRQAFIGFVASLISDTISNFLRVLKTYRQVNETKVGYAQAARLVIAQDGLKGLFFRGLTTRWLANGLQGLTFSVLWKLFLDLWDRKVGS